MLPIMLVNRGNAGAGALPTFLDNMDGAAGAISGNADTGEARSVTNGIVLLTGTGAAHLDTNNSNSMTVSAKASSDTFTVGGLGRPHKNQSGFGVLFNQWDANRRLFKAEVV